MSEAVAEARAGRSQRFRPGSILRALGLVCLAAALVLGGYVAWLLWGTGLATARAQHQLRDVIAHQIEHPRQGGTSSAGTAGHSHPVPPKGFTIAEGDPVALIYIPRIGLDMVVVEGTSTEDLKKGPGHYLNTSYPWDDTGSVAIAGHRTTYQHPFWSLDKLGEGDLIELRTEFGTYRYRVDRSVVIRPSESWVLKQTRSPTLVLTACTPRFSASHRLVVFASRE
jgi:sortase A